MQQRLVINLKDLKVLVVAIEESEAAMDELANCGGFEGNVIVSIIRSQDDGELIFKVLH